MDSMELPADTDGARKTALRAHAIVVKLKEMGLPEHLDADLARLSTDLSDICHAESVLDKQLKLLLESSEDWQDIGDCLIDLRTTLDHIGWHIKSAGTPAKTIAMFSYHNAS